MIPCYPLTAVVGQASVLRALSIALVNPRAGALLISGTRGTAKSVLVRAAGVFTPVGRLSELPLSASADMVFGTIDVEAAIARGERRLWQGILSRAAGSILYMDEVNLLREDILLAVLKAAADGFFRLERYGLSYRVETAYTPIGTMDPAEGTLPPVLLESFGMFVAMDEEMDAEKRCEIVTRVISFEKNPAAFRAVYAAKEKLFGEVVRAARDLLPQVEIPEAIFRFAAACTMRANCIGNHAEIYLVEAARAIAALSGRMFVLPKDVEEAAEFVLVHRMRGVQEECSAGRRGGDDGAAAPSGESQADAPSKSSEPRIPEDAAPAPDEGISSKNAGEQNGSSKLEEGGGAETGDPPSEEQKGEATEHCVPPIESVMMRLSLLRMMIREGSVKSGRRDIVEMHTADGRGLRVQPAKNGARVDLALIATICAAAPFQRIRQGKQAVTIHPEDVRTWVRTKRTAVNIVFLVDASGSMGARERMRIVKGAILALLREAYQKRDRVALAVFRRDAAETILPLTRSVELAEKRLRDLPTGGRTPLAEGLEHARKILHECVRKGGKTVLVLLTDGRANVDDDGLRRAMKAAEVLAGLDILSVVLDTEKAVPRVGIAKEIARRMEARYYTLEQLSSEGVLEIVHDARA